MNHEKIHNQIIQRAKARIPKGYVEEHHIIPRCMSGSDEPDNLVKLTAREHYIIHKLLVEIYKDLEIVHKLHHAVWMMANMRNKDRNYVISSREYERLRISAGLASSIDAKINPNSTCWKPGQEAWNKGITHSTDHRNNLSLANSGKRHLYKDDNSIVVDPEQVEKLLNEGWTQGRLISNNQKLAIKEAGIKRRGSKWMVKGDDLAQILPDEIDLYLERGWIFQGNTTSYKWINKGADKITVPESELDEYLNLGWKLGRPMRHITNTKWMNNGIQNKRIKQIDLEEFKSSGWSLGRIKK